MHTERLFALFGEIVSRDQVFTTHAAARVSTPLSQKSEFELSLVLAFDIRCF